MIKFTDNRFPRPQPVVAEISRYRNGQLGIVLKTEEGDLWSVPTAALAHVELADGCVLVKDYSENSGMPALLIRAGVIEPEVLDYVPSGFVQLAVHALTPAVKALALARDDAMRAA